MPTLADVLRQTGYAQDGTLATPTPTESPMTKVLAEHIASIPQKFATNQAEQMALLNKAFPGNTYESMMTQGDPKAMAELAMQTPFNAMIAYHGTPHKILGNFDISKVGTGEGAQAYGHGMYFAEAKPVAEQYRKDLSAIVNYDQNTKKYQVLDRDRKLLGEYDNMLKAGQEAEKAGNLYKVDIPDEYIPNMLDWDKPLIEQTPEVQAAIQKLGDRFRPLDEREAKNVSGERLYRRIENSLGKFYGNAANPEASKMLNDVGIKGIRYSDAGSRPTNIIDKRLESLYQKHGGDVEKAADDFMRTIHDTPKKKAEIRAGIIKDLQNRPTSNFVVFDPSTVKILEENGKPLTRKELIEKQVKELKD